MAARLCREDRIVVLLHRTLASETHGATIAVTAERILPCCETGYETIGPRMGSVRSFGEIRTTEDFPSGD
jgi:hypothetical protein